MPIKARILADSSHPYNNTRITTWELTYPRCIHAEMLTHRQFSRNSASSRAIPVEKMLENIVNDPFIPLNWGKNQKGMQAGEELSACEIEGAQREWLKAREYAVKQARELHAMGLHKQIVNRIVEPWMWITVLVTATEYSNFFKLRNHKDAEPHFQILAKMMQETYEAATPKKLEIGEWHLPLWGFEGDEDWLKDYRSIKHSSENRHDYMAPVAIATGRCARVSYLTHEGKRDPQADIDLHDRLSTSCHWSPFEHCAQAINHRDSYSNRMCGNFAKGWLQYRKLFQGECG